MESYNKLSVDIIEEILLKLNNDNPNNFIAIIFGNTKSVTDTIRKLDKEILDSLKG